MKAVNIRTLTPSFPGQWDSWKLACAHEIGHMLGLGTRGVPPLPRPPTGTPERILKKQESHDIGLFPVRAYRVSIGHEPSRSTETMYGLMWPEIVDDIHQTPYQHHFISRWLRHEDWKQASNKAQLYLK